MKFAKGLLMGIGALALAASLMDLVAPKAVHGAVAALVQVANTAAAPAITQDVPHLASQHLELICEATIGCAVPNPSSLTPYVVQAGQNFVVTSVDILGTGGDPSGVAALALVLPAAGLSRIWRVPDDGYTHSFQYPSGYVFPAGYTFVSANVSTFNLSIAYLEGFLTSN